MNAFLDYFQHKVYHRSQERGCRNIEFLQWLQYHMSLSKESIGSKDPTDHQPLEKNTAVVSVISSKDIAFCHLIKNSVCSRTGLIVRVDTNVVKETHRDEICSVIWVLKLGAYYLQMLLINRCLRYFGHESQIDTCLQPIEFVCLKRQSSSSDVVECWTNHKVDVMAMFIKAARLGYTQYMWKPYKK